jgi:glycosyltransferase involved in cell wall biosynthesis
MSRPRVSARVAVLGATFRGGPYLQAALESLQAQTFLDWCLVMVDDGSPRPGEIAAAVERIDRPALLVRQERRGLSAARNVALARSDSEMVVVFDDDDLWMPSRLETQVGVLDRETEAVGCHTQFEIIDGQGVVTHPGDAATATYEQLLDLSRHLLGPTAVLRRELVNLVGWYNSALPSAEDLDLLWRLAALGPLVFIDEVLYQHRRHGKNVTNNIDITAWSSVELLRLHRLAARSAEDGQLVNAADRGIRAARHYWALQAAGTGASALRQRDLVETCRNLNLAWRLAPTSVIGWGLARMRRCGNSA